MINTVEKIWANAIAQVCKEIADENDIWFLLRGGWTPEEISEEWYNAKQELKFIEKKIGNAPSDAVSGDEEALDHPVDWATFQSRVNARYSQLTYQRFRAAEYPSIHEYIDGIVKGDQAQVDAYIAKCAEVKAKYAKDMIHPGNQSLIDGQSRLA